MGYRIGEPKPRPPRRDMSAATTPNVIYVPNCTIANLAIPCWYEEVLRPIPARIHNRDLHDHEGWPGPHHPDGSCQEHEFASEEHRHHLAWYLDQSNLIPIHLTKEGYHVVKVALNTDKIPDEIEGSVSAVGEIDSKDDWIIRLKFSPKITSYIEDNISIPFSVYAEGDDAVDLVATGKLVVLPTVPY